MVYLLLPFLAWIVAGCTKFFFNFIRFGKEAKKHIGYGGFPSTHTTILSSVVFFSGFQEGFQTPLFSVGLGALLILVIDANGLRNKVGTHAQVLNKLQQDVILREKMGHSWGEIAGGLGLGLLLGYGASLFA